MYSELLKKFEFKNGISLKNSIVMAPMTTWSSNDDYTVSDEEAAYYSARNNGAGMIITGCTHVQENGIGFTNEFAGYDDSFIPSLKKLASAITENNAKAILQINHAGNKALPELIENGDVVSASPVETKATTFVPSLKPRELLEKISEAELKAETIENSKIGIEPANIARAIAFAIEQPQDVGINEMVIRPTLEK